MELKQIIANNIKYYRTYFKKSQFEFANILNTTKSYLSQIENAKIDTTTNNINKYIKNINKTFKVNLTVENLVCNNKHINNKNHNLTLEQIISINIKYYRKKYNKNQNDFADILDIDYARLCEIEHHHLNLKCSTIDKFVNNLNNFDNNINLTTDDLVKYSEKHLTNYKRIDEKREK